jgi:hypothetical protein
MKLRTLIAIVFFALLALSPIMTAAQEPPAAQPPAKDQATPAEPPPQARPPAAPAQPGPEVFRGTIVNQSGEGTRYWLGDWFDLQIDQYNSDEDAMALAVALRDEGQKAVLDKLWTMKQVGMLKVGGRGDAFPIFLARSKTSPAGRVIRCFTTRRIAPSDLNFGPRSMEYPFGIIEIILPVEGAGTGQIVGMVQLGFSADTTIAVKAYGLVPMRLMNVALKPEAINK